MGTWGTRGPGRGRASKPGLPASFRGRVRMQTQGLAYPGVPATQAAQSRCGAADPSWSLLQLQPLLPTCPANCLSHTWQPHALWKSDQPCAALQEDSWYMGVGRQGWSGKWSSGQKAGAALAGQGETSSLHLLCDLGLLAGPLWARSALGHWNLELQD